MYREAAIRFGTEEPDLFGQIDELEEKDNGFWSKALVPPTTIRSRKNYGIVHGEFHMDNFHISRVGSDFQITVFNFDHLIRSFYLLDCGTVLHQIFTKLKFPEIEV